MKKYLLISLVCLNTTHAAIYYPADSGIIDVTNPPGTLAAAVGDGVTDDTAAINAILAVYNNTHIDTAHINASRIIYFPSGTYRITDTIGAFVDGEPASTVSLYGAGVEETTIKLDNNASGFGEGATKFAIQQGKINRETDSGPDAAFSNLIKDMTIDLGTNQGAIGIMAMMANMGRISDLKIIATRAKAGIATYDRAGPGLIKNVEIDGCDTGVTTFWDYGKFDFMWFPGRSHTDQVTFENITIKNYRESAFLNEGKHFVVRGLTLDAHSQSSQPSIVLDVYENTPAQMEILDLTILDGDGKDGIEVRDDESYLYLRNASFNNCGSTKVDFYSGADVTSNYVEELSDGISQSKFSNGRQLTLNLPIKEHPVYVPSSLSDWTKTTMSQNLSASQNRTRLQSDLNNCDTAVLYIPYGKYQISGNITINNNKLKMIKGFFSYLEGAPKVTITNTDQVLHIEDICITINAQYIHNMNKPLVFTNIGIGPIIKNTDLGTGDLFIENIGAQPRVRLKNGIHAFLRQFNRETQELTNDGAVIWCLGDNTEQKDNQLPKAWTTSNGGVSEIIGANFDNQKTLAGLSPSDYNFLYEVKDSSSLSLMGTGIYFSDFGSTPCIVIDEAGEHYEIKNDNNTVSLNEHGPDGRSRQLLLPYVSNKSDLLAFYPFNDGSSNSKLSHHHLARSFPGSINEMEECGFVDRILGVNGNCKNVNGGSLNDATLSIDDTAEDYWEFSIGPNTGGNGGYSVSGISFDYAGENNALGSDFTMRVYVTNGNGTTLGDYAEITVINNETTNWKSHFVDLSNNPQYQNLLRDGSDFRLYFTMDQRNWRCMGFIDNVAVHGILN